MRHRHWNWSLSLIGWGLIFTLLLSACAAPSQPTNQPANLELDSLQQAAYYYARYHALAPDDLLGLKRLVEVCTALEDPSTGPFGEAQDRLRAGAGVEDESCGEAAALREELEARTGDRRIVAGLLGVPVEDVELGPNLVQNSGFEEKNDQPDGWFFGILVTCEKLFIGGLDDLRGQKNGVRIVGLRDETLIGGGTTSCYAQYKADNLFLMSPSEWYVISFEYQSQYFQGSAGGLFFLGEYSPSGRIFTHLPLEGTGDRWRRIYIVDQFRSDDAVAMALLVRNRTSGNIWFDDVGVRQVSIQSQAEK